MTITVRTVDSPEEHAAASKRLLELAEFDLEKPSPERSEFLALCALVKAWEDINLPELPKVDPIEHILFAMDQMELKNKDMVPYFGSTARASEVLNRKRPLTLPMIRKLNKGLGIPLELLVSEYQKQPVAS